MKPKKHSLPQLPPRLYAATLASAENLTAIAHSEGIELGDKKGISTPHLHTILYLIRDRCIEAYGVEYTESTVTVLTLQFILDRLDCPKEFDLLSIDCEAMDVDVLNSLDLGIYKPTLICMECGTDIPGYELYHKTCGNTIYRRVK